MPIISVFLGITVRMYFGDHAPPHVHVLYQGHEALMAVDDGRVLEGALPPRARKLAKEWMALRKSAIMSNWRKAERFEPLERIEGLE